jgi:hypothetical protein
MPGFEPLKMNLSEEELKRLADFLKGWDVADDDAIEYGMAVLFDAGRYELAEPTRKKLMKMLSRAGMPFSGSVQ